MRKKINSLYGMAGLLLCMIACRKEDVITGNGRDTYINFYNASEVLQQHAAYSGENLIIINDTLPDVKQPQFSPSDDFRQFPRHFTGSELVVDAIYPPAGATYNVVYWMPMIADASRFIYTSVNKTYLKDTVLNLSPKTFTTQYLVESPGADDAYRILTVPVERQGTPGKVRVQVLNLSPDLGPLEVFLADEDGNRVNTSLPTDLSFGQHSSYAELDTAGASATFGKLTLKFCKSGNDETLLGRAIDAVPNSSYIIVFQGFEQETSRRIKTGNHQYEQVMVAPNLRVNVRRVY